MNWLSWQAICVMTVIMQSGIVTCADIGRAWFIGMANTRVSVAEWLRQDPYTCTEYITSPTGRMIMRNDYPVKGPRQHRYDSNYEGQYSVMIPIKNASLDDGGRYECDYTSYESKEIYTLTVIDNVTCDASEDHKVLEGESITYSCTFKYQGVYQDRMVDWVGIGISRSTREHLDRHAVLNAQKGTSYVGRVRITTTKTARSYHGTANRTSSLTFRDAQGQKVFQHSTGQMIVIYKRKCSTLNCGNNGSCTEDMQCRGDVDCLDSHPACVCDSIHVGNKCQFMIGCNDIACLKESHCLEDHTGLFHCKCTAGYKGRYCDEAIQPPFCLPMYGWRAGVVGERKKNSPETSLSYLAILLVLPAIAVGVAAYCIYSRSRARTSVDEGVGDAEVGDD